MLYVALKEYLAGLEARESTRPPAHRRDVPTMSDLARVAGINKQTMSRWVGGQIKSTNHQTAGAIIAELRRRGFATEVGDILGYSEEAD